MANGWKNQNSIKGGFIMDWGFIQGLALFVLPVILKILGVS